MSININDTPHTSTSGTMTIAELNALHSSGGVMFPLWQREDDWPKEHKEQLIGSVLNKTVIPIIFLAEVICRNGKTKTMVIDGGHRLRTFAAFKRTEKPLSFRIKQGENQKQVYYDTPSSSSSLCLNDIGRSKEDFDNYKIYVVTYKKLTESDARKIFNMLQNQRPMTTAECVNSIASPLVDFLRGRGDMTLENGNSVTEMLQSITRVNTDNHEFLLHLLSIWNMTKVDPNSTTKKMEALKHCKTSDSIVNDVKEDTDDLVQEDINNLDRMLNMMNYYIKILAKFKLAKTDVFTVAHFSFYEYVDETAIKQQKFEKAIIEFFQTLAVFKKKTKERIEAAKKRHPDMDHITKLEKEIARIDKSGLFYKFVESHTGGGNWGIGPTGMLHRYEVIRDYLTITD